MKARCIQNGQAYTMGGKKPVWCEVGQVHDVDVERMGGLPKHFEEVKVKASDKPAATGKKAPGAPLTTDNL